MWHRKSVLPIVTFRCVDYFLTVYIDPSMTLAQMGSQSTTELDSMTVDDLCEWLDSQGIPSEFCAKFKGEPMEILIYKSSYSYGMA